MRLSISSSFFSSSTVSPFFFSSSFSSFWTEACISLAFSSFGTNSGTIIFEAYIPIYCLNSSLLGACDGISILKTFALRHAIDVTKRQWRGFLGSNSAGTGGLLGSVQNRLPSLVLESRGYTWSNYRMSWLKNFSNFNLAKWTQSSNVLGFFSIIFNPSFKDIASYCDVG